MHTQVYTDVIKNKRNISIGQKNSKIRGFKYRVAVWLTGSKNLSQELKGPQRFVRNNNRGGVLPCTLGLGKERKTSRTGNLTYTYTEVCQIYQLPA